MNLYIEIIDELLELNSNTVTTICIENKSEYRAIIDLLIQGNPVNDKFVLSDNYVPLKSSDFCFVSDYFNINVSPTIVKKIYSSIEKYCNDDFFDATLELKAKITEFFYSIIEQYDFELEFNDNIALPDIFKAVSLKPRISSEILLESLLEYILLVQKYSKFKCFVFANLHVYFSEKELAKLYSDLHTNEITIVNVESSLFFESSPLEKIIIIDEDLCKIVDN